MILVTACYLDAHKRETWRKKGVQCPKILDEEIVDECCADMQDVMHKQIRKVSDFQLMRVLMKGQL